MKIEKVLIYFLSFFMIFILTIISIITSDLYHIKSILFRIIPMFILYGFIYLVYKLFFDSKRLYNKQIKYYNTIKQLNTNNVYEELFIKVFENKFTKILMDNLNTFNVRNISFLSANIKNKKSIIIKFVYKNYEVRILVNDFLSYQYNLFSDKRTPFKKLNINILDIDNFDTLLNKITKLIIDIKSEIK